MNIEADESVPTYKKIYNSKKENIFISWVQKWKIYIYIEIKGKKEKPVLIWTFYQPRSTNNLDKIETVLAIITRSFDGATTLIGDANIKIGLLCIGM